MSEKKGALIGTEGRRLSDMVERVMAFAGIGGGASSRPAAAVDVARVVDDACRSLQAEARMANKDSSSSRQ